eukprot:gnl/TRDRNA2_/TRDRNA2_81400_c0_seq2.p1 gnl/TRDRNA2_/TRDRNA2_81400_c0~~gnl/TRDRNA2_/TRDRNA2_81400_c0_seq2.p1  ORF type:complete len:248 (-),score=29.67 gnl/TRDRNA2_/TRDRNA2_81400_c0_seq2:71-715(-)
MTRCEPTQRWWLREVTGDKSWSKGLYEVQSGLVHIHTKPVARSPSLGVMQAGTRFLGIPKLVGESVWIKLITKGVSPPLFSLANASLRDTMQPSCAAISADEVLHRFYDSSGKKPLAHPLSEDEVIVTDPIWVEDNKQYITRLRDIGREKGRRSYSSLTHAARKASSLGLSTTCENLGVPRASLDRASVRAAAKAARRRTRSLADVRVSPGGIR